MTRNEFSVFTPETTYAALKEAGDVNTHGAAQEAGDGVITGENGVEIPTRREAGMMEVTDKGNWIRYESEIDGVFNGQLPAHEEIIMGRTPEILSLYGAPDVSLHITQASVRKMAYPEGYQGGKHNLGVQAVKELPGQLSNPLAILENKSHPGTGLVAFTEWVDMDGNTVIVPIKFGSHGTVDIQSHVPTAFGRADLSQYLGNNNENVIYTRNDENIANLLAHGRQLPEPQESDDVFITDTIPQAGEVVKDAGRKSFEDVKGILLGNRKYGANGINDRRTVFKNKVIEWIRKMNFKALEAEDIIFMRSAYIDSYAQAMKARGYGMATINQTEIIRSYKI